MKILSMLSIFILVLFFGSIQAFAGNGGMVDETGTHFCDDGSFITYDESFCGVSVGEAVDVTVDDSSTTTGDDCEGLTITSCEKRTNNGNKPRGTGKGGNAKDFSFTFGSGPPATLQLDSVDTDLITAHFDCYLSNGDKIGVNLSLGECEL